jgi:hypothetical protein
MASPKTVPWTSREDVRDPKLPGPDALLRATIASCTERTFEQHDFDGCPTP